MAGGEKAKSSGTYGEKIVAELIQLIGWKEFDDGVTVPCIKESHSTEDKKSEKHGIDYVVQYKSYLRDYVRQDVLISVKCRDGYPKTEQGIKSKFREFYEDLVAASECYPSSEPFKRKMSNTKKKIYSGIIFWIDRNREDGREYESIVDSLFNIRLQENNFLESVALIDNGRAQFLFETLTHVHNNYGKENVNFFYIDTGLNNANFNKLYSGPLMPVEYICSDVIPLVISIENNQIFYLIVKDGFNKEYLKRLIGLAQELTRTLANKIIIAFPDYNEFEHKQLSNEAKFEFDDSKFTSNITITTYKRDFRDGV